MPYEVARIKLLVKRVWVGQLLYIKKADALAEDVKKLDGSKSYMDYLDPDGLGFDKAICLYLSLWIKING